MPPGRARIHVACLFLAGTACAGFALADPGVEQRPAVVSGVFSPTQLLVRTTPAAALAVGDRVVFRDRLTRRARGWGEVEMTYPDQTQARVRLILHAQNELVVVGDEVSVIDTRRENQVYTGRVDLLLRGNKRISSRYKTLAWSGPFFGYGHALEQGELLIDPIMIVQYGITDRLTVFTMQWMHVVGAYNGGVKFRLFDNSYFLFTPTVAFIALPRASHIGFFNVGGRLTLPTNSKFVSHLDGYVAVGVGKHELDLTTMTAKELQAMTLRRTVETKLQSFHEYIFDNWDRIQAGPTYNVERKALGGSLGYLMVFDHFHVGLQFQTVDFTNLKISFDSGYFPWLTFFWRV